MTNSQIHRVEVLQDRYGLKIAARLSGGAEDLPHDISERLRVARGQAVAKRKVGKPVGATAVLSAGGSAVLGAGDEHLSWWGRIVSVLPLLALAIGLVTINAVQNEKSARELAAIDAALLVDDLPPAAYADPGFAQFIKIGHNQAQ
jgi:hypothetical protein